ncbi:MAG: diguanylate cyclase [Thermoleophilia bacterium]|nr:diguanylate cyclase [Thermoleophilia bacterium]
MLDVPQGDALPGEALATANVALDVEPALVGALQRIAAERSRATEAYGALVRSLGAVLGVRDAGTGEHSNAVRDLAVAVGRALGLEGRALAEVEACALLHDIGKVGISDAILKKQGALDDAEWVIMRQHPVIGAQIIRNVPGLGGVAQAVRHQHERWDGNGYPDRLAGEEIPLTSRIVFVCDAFDALVSDRPYRRAVTIDEALAEVERSASAHFDPMVVVAVLEYVRAGVSAASVGSDLADLLTSSDGSDDVVTLERKLLALVRVASLVATAATVGDMVEAAADEACRAVGADTLSVSRFDPATRSLQVVVNVGDLQPGEHRRPSDEVYLLEDDDAFSLVLIEGHSYTASLDDPQAFETEVQFLRQAGKHSSVGVPIMLGAMAWGELWAAYDDGHPAFAPGEVRFLELIAGQIAAAVARAELFTRMETLAYRDSLTGIGNRRAFEDRLESCVAEAHEQRGDVALLLMDLDRLKETNDVSGHASGDAALTAVARALAAEAATAGSEMAYRIGGDEFCLLLAGDTAEEARLAGERLIAELFRSESAISVSVGVSSLGLGFKQPSDILRAADRALYTAKRTGRNRVCVADTDESAVWSGLRRPGAILRRRVRVEGSPGSDAFIEAALEALDGELAAAEPVERLEGLATIICDSFDAARASISYLLVGSDSIVTHWTVNVRAGRTWTKAPDIVGDSYYSGDYPQSVRIMAKGGSFVVRAGDPASDPAERELLESFGMTALIAAACPDDDRCWLVEIYLDADFEQLEQAELAVRLLVAEAVRCRLKPPVVESAVLDESDIVGAG